MPGVVVDAKIGRDREHDITLPPGLLHKNTYLINGNSQRVGAKQEYRRIPLTSIENRTSSERMFPCSYRINRV